ncbi:MAG: hypothetical protein MI923_06160 [Phycisphaerales bacterium]|nr:hypothetical protein [Phycisphaerales bacterium]
MSSRQVRHTAPIWDAFSVGCRKTTCLSGKKTRTRPWPFFWHVNQAAPHWVHVDILNLGVYCPGIEHVSVITTTTLPKSIGCLAIGLNVLQAFEKIGSMLFQPSNRRSRHRLFDIAEDFADRVFGFKWPDEQMHVIWH